MGTVVMLLVTLLVDTCPVVVFSSGVVDMFIMAVLLLVVMGIVVTADGFDVMLFVDMGRVVTADEFVVVALLIAGATELAATWKSSRCLSGTEIANSNIRRKNQLIWRRSIFVFVIFSTKSPWLCRIIRVIKEYTLYIC